MTLAEAKQILAQVSVDPASVPPAKVAKALRIVANNLGMQ